MEWKIDKALGYVYAIDRSSLYANSQGKVYQHHYVLCHAVGRALMPDECVHHIDRDRANNQLENLMLLTHSQHAKLQALEDRGFLVEQRSCPACSMVFVVSSISDQAHCSLGCARKMKRRFEISDQDLRAMVWSMPSTHVAKILGVSGVAVAKRCRIQKVPTPPRGYWAKLRAQKL